MAGMKKNALDKEIQMVLGGAFQIEPTLGNREIDGGEHESSQCNRCRGGLPRVESLHS
jgi:hypothetical protein